MSLICQLTALDMQRQVLIGGKNSTENITSAEKIMWKAIPQDQQAWKGFDILWNAVAACFLLRLTYLLIQLFMFLNWRGISTRKGG